MHIVMLAAENGALPGGKVGGMGDVVRDIPTALAALGHRVTVLTPGYDRFSHLPGAYPCGVLQARFRGEQTPVSLYQIPEEPARAGVSVLVLEHPEFSACGSGRIYCDDPPDRPFATDASKFALFCAASGQALHEGLLEQPDVLHLHDWHAALLAVLIHHDPQFTELRKLPLVFTIHNLALQGIRPFRGDHSSLASWFPHLSLPRQDLSDPRYTDCFNPMRAAITLCDKVHAVSPTYAREICDPDSDSGAGLQKDLQAAHAAKRLEGILNGCEYPGHRPQLAEFSTLLADARQQVLRWIGGSGAVVGADLVALRTLDEWIAAGCEKPPLLVTSVGRLTEQKLGLLTEFLGDGRSCLEHVLDAVGEDGLLIVLGNGSAQLETFVGEAASRRSNMLFLRGYSDPLAAALYTAGDLFLMPSTFEPCGISQMLAMRAGQPCLVNAVGGLTDTVEDAVTGFVFRGDSPGDCAQALVARLKDALVQLRRHPRKTAAMRKAAAARRFLWKDAAVAYVANLYAAVPPRAHKG